MSAYLNEWKNKKNKECLLIIGARQVGKTFIIRDFATKNYDHLVELNFVDNPEYKEVFSGSLNMDSLIEKISLKNNKFRFVPGKTLIFLDEIQKCGDARTALKFIAEDNRFDCIASGSMLGIALKTISSVPVGYERIVEMFSLDFEEFLWALGYEKDVTKTINEHFHSKTPVDELINNTFLDLFRKYIVVGGMPKAVEQFVLTKNYGIVHEEQEKIYKSYLADITQYSEIPEKELIRKCYLSLPKQLAKENKKFQYSAVEKGGRSSKYLSSIDWLIDAGLVVKCTNVSTPKFPLIAYASDDYYKIYSTDIGLLTYMYGFSMKEAIITNEISGPVKGALYENAIADILLKKKIALYYYKKDESKQEIEFLINDKHHIIPVEVKAGNSASYSLNEFIEKEKPLYAYKFITGNIGVVNEKITLPLYMAMFL